MWYGNWVDWVFIGVVLFFALVSHGFLATCLEVLSFFVSLFFSYQWYTFFGKLLMQHLETLLKGGDVKSLFIEVAVSNHAALALYASCGFEKAGMRKNYYERNDGKREDALIMRKGL